MVHRVMCRKKNKCTPICASKSATGISGLPDQTVRHRALLVARKQLLGRLLDVELSIRGILRGFGLKVGQVTRKTFEARIRELVTGHTTLGRIAEFWRGQLCRRSTRNCTKKGCARDCSSRRGLPTADDSA